MSKKYFFRNVERNSSAKDVNLMLRTSCVSRVTSGHAVDNPWTDYGQRVDRKVEPTVVIENKLTKR